MTQTISEDEFQAKLEEAKVSAKTYGEIAGLPPRQGSDDLESLERQIAQVSAELERLLTRREKLVDPYAKRRQEVVHLRRDLKLSFTEIAKMFGVSTKRVRQLYEDELRREQRAQSDVQDGNELHELDLPIRVNNSLRRGGVYTIQQVREFLVAPNAFEVRNVGAEGFSQLQRALEEYDEAHRGSHND